MEHQTSQVPTASIFTTTEDIIRPPEIPVHHVTLIEVPHVNPISELPVCHWTRIKVRDLNLNLRRLNISMENQVSRDGSNSSRQISSLDQSQNSRGG